MAAATRIIASDGLGAPTALIAKEAGVSTGSLFTYFATKTDLLNELYVDLKMETASAALHALPRGADMRRQLAHMWHGWLGWAASNPDKRRALAHFSVSHEITEESRNVGHQAMAGIASLVARSRQGGAMRDAPLALVVALMSAIADTTVDFMIKDPSNADAHSATSFEAMWRMLADTRRNSQKTRNKEVLADE